MAPADFAVSADCGRNQSASKVDASSVGYSDSADHGHSQAVQGVLQCFVGCRTSAQSVDIHAECKGSILGCG